MRASGRSSTTAQASPRLHRAGYHFDRRHRCAGHRAVAVHVRRQNHHLSPPGRKRCGQLAECLPILKGSSWTARKPLPGGDFPVSDTAVVGEALRSSYPFLDAVTAERLARTYGTLAGDWLGSAKNMADLGADFGHGLTGAEVDYLVAQEWAQTAEDILWRRTKLGLRFNAAQTETLVQYLSQNRHLTRSKIL